MTKTIRISNLTTSPYKGWVAAPIDFDPPHPVGKIGTKTLFVHGRQCGLDTRMLHVRTFLMPFEEAVIDLDQAAPGTFSLSPPPGGPIAYFGGEVMLDGVPMTWVSLKAEAACYKARLRRRVGRMFSVEVFVTWYPDTPFLAWGRAIVTCSNPAVPDLFDTVMPGTMRLTFGEGILVPLFGPHQNALVAPGSTFADGQSRVVPFTIVFPRHVSGDLGGQDWASFAARASGGITMVGIRQLLPDGNPGVPANLDVRMWTVQRISEASRRLHTFEPAVVGPAPDSPSAGEQEDSAFAGGEIMAPGRLGAELVRYWSALKLAGRPCHHLEADGSQLDPNRHLAGGPLIFWNGRPHDGLWSLVDRLGKPGTLTKEQCSGWWGPDVEHAMFATLSAACRLTGCEAAQWLLRQQAIQYPLQWTTTHGWSTSQPYAARAVGWEAILAVHLWFNLEDRALAGRVRSHWLTRFSQILGPQLGTAEFDIWDVRVDDPRLGPGPRWIPWQQALGAYGLDLAGAQFGLPEAREIALRAAQRVLADAWRKVDGKWFCCESGLQAVPDGEGLLGSDFNHYGMPLAPCVILRHDPQHAVSREIITQVRGAATDLKHLRWIAPGTP